MGIEENLATLPDWDEIEQQERMEEAIAQREREREKEMEEELKFYE